jgi:hypothetical protein
MVNGTTPYRPINNRLDAVISRQTLRAVKTWRTRSADDLSVRTLLMLAVGIGLWTIY